MCDAPLAIGNREHGRVDGDAVAFLDTDAAQLARVVPGDGHPYRLSGKGLADERQESLALGDVVGEDVVLGGRRRAKEIEECLVHRQRLAFGVVDLEPEGSDGEETFEEGKRVFDAGEGCADAGESR